MISNWIRRVVMRTLEERYAHINQPVPDGPRHKSITGRPVVTVHRLSNGYLLAADNDTPYLSENQTLVFCDNLSDIGNQIITMEARTRMGVSSNVALSNPAQQRNLAAAMQQQSYTP